MNLVSKQRKKYVLEWATELAEYLGRSDEEIRSRGLNASDFSLSASVSLTFPDGSNAYFKHAFCVKNEAKSAIAVFTEHCGYHVFPLSDTEVVSNT